MNPLGLHGVRSSFVFLNLLALGDKGPSVIQRTEV